MSFFKEGAILTGQKEGAHPYHNYPQSNRTNAFVVEKERDFVDSAGSRHPGEGRDPVSAPKIWIPAFELPPEISSAFGKQGMKMPRRAYTTEFKERVVKRIQDGQSVSVVCNELKLSGLRAENLRLKRENEILKKRHVLRKECFRDQRQEKRVAQTIPFGRRNNEGTLPWDEHHF